MPNPSELARQEYDRAAPSAEGEIGVKMLTREELVARVTKEMEDFDNGQLNQPALGSFERKLEQLLNEHSMEGAGGDTPDFILARFLRLQLDIFHHTVRRRDHWYGRDKELVDTVMLREEANRG